MIGEEQLLGGCVRDTEVVGYPGEHVPPAECVAVCDVEVLVVSARRQSRPCGCAGEQPGVGDLVQHVGCLLGAGNRSGMFLCWHRVAYTAMAVNRFIGLPVATPQTASGRKMVTANPSRSARRRSRSSWSY